MTIRQKLEALGLYTGDHDADVHLALDEVAQRRFEAIEADERADEAWNDALERGEYEP